MPKIKQEEQDEDSEDYVDEDEEEDDEDLEEELEKEERSSKKPFKLKRNPGRPKEEPKVPKRRYGVVAPQPLRIVDVEAQEVLAEGEHLTAQAFTDIIERLERIENLIGSMTEG